MENKWYWSGVDYAAEFANDLEASSALIACKETESLHDDVWLAIDWYRKVKGKSGPGNAKSTVKKNVQLKAAEIERYRNSMIEYFKAHDAYNCGATAAKIATTLYPLYPADSDEIETQAAAFRTE